MLGTRVNLNQNLDPQFYKALFEELASKDQLKNMLHGIEPGILGAEELILLNIWSSPLIQRKGQARDPYSDQAR